jgi:hypothetical protein
VGFPRRDQDRVLQPLATGVQAIDGLTQGGFPRGQISEIYGPLSSGATSLALCALARITAQGSLASWIDPQDRLDPSSVASMGVDWRRLLWLRGQGPELHACLSAAGTLLGSGLFELLVLDLSEMVETALRGLPPSTWVRLARFIEGTPVALLLLARHHTCVGPQGVSLRLTPTGSTWRGAGPGRLLGGFVSEACLAHGRGVVFERRV